MKETKLDDTNAHRIEWTPEEMAANANMLSVVLAASGIDPYDLSIAVAYLTTFFTAAVMNTGSKDPETVKRNARSLFENALNSYNFQMVIERKELIRQSASDAPTKQ